MTWPPILPPNDRTDSTPQAVNHPSDHRMIADALADIVAQFATITSKRLGEIFTMWVPTGGTLTVPDEALLCDGSAFDAGSFPDLATYLGGTTLPDLRGRFLRGAGGFSASYGTLAGSDDAIVVAHAHTTGYKENGSGAGDSHYARPVGYSSTDTLQAVNSSGSSGTNKNVPKFANVGWLIQAV